ncbi:MAG: D-alanine--D-alanine ligase [Patescibacteria group bacterium]|nr:D-alanine--D-alanine ligase [Patescibacteria group bacterium]
MEKLKIALIFGGRSGEHEVSIMSASSLEKAIDREKYTVLPIYIQKSGKWMKGETIEELLAGKGLPVLISPNQKEDTKLTDFFLFSRSNVDAVFPLLHGPYGEDGTIQGLLEMIALPYVGADVLGSALGMDKAVMKGSFADAGLKTVPNLAFLRKGWEKDPLSIVLEIEKKLKFPVFVKPANLGSSVGVTKVHANDELKEAINLACRYDRKFLVEQGINCREIKVSVLGNDRPRASVCGEVILLREFYDYEAKYKPGGSKLVIPADLPEDISNKIRSMALMAYKAIDCGGMGRVDFLLEKETNEIYINEINTIPGFTEMSMYPKLWQVEGMSYKELIDKLIELALERYRDKDKNLVSYET